MASRFNAAYARSMAKRPMLTLCAVNGTLALLSDILAQSLPHILGEQRSEKIASRQLAPEAGEKIAHHQPQPSAVKNAVVGAVKNIKDEVLTGSAAPVSVASAATTGMIGGVYDPVRSLRLVCYNAGIAPVVQTWFMTLDKFLPMKAGATGAGVAGVVMKRVVADQLLFAPVGLAAFFGVMATLEGVDVRQRFRDTYVSALTANWQVWPLVQFVNFKFVPISYRVPFVGSVGVIWTAYLSWLNANAKTAETID